MSRKKIVADPVVAILDGLKRLLPPDELADPGRKVDLFRPAPELAEWITEAFLVDRGPLFNGDHQHLQELDSEELCCLWTNVESIVQQRQVAALAEMPKTTGRKWPQLRGYFQLKSWFGATPVFLLTFDAVLWAEASNAVACSRADHELYHCSYKRDEDGEMRYGWDDKPAWEIRGHDSEQFVGVVRRWGAAASGVSELVQAALDAERSPWFSDQELAAACGTCGGRL